MRCEAVEGGAGILALLFGASIALLPARSVAQHRSSAILDVGASDTIDRWRLAALVDGADEPRFFLRSTSSLADWSNPGARAIAPRVVFVHNSRLPYGSNLGWMWPGRGANWSVTAGAELRFSRWRLIAAPEFTYSTNKFVERDTKTFYAPDIPADRSLHTLVWYSRPYSVDYPIRFGSAGLRRLTPGQSSVTLRVRGGEIGFATENEWWGVSFRNPLVLSTNAPGFPHFFIRSVRPWRTPLGALEFRWIVGGLSESGFFDTTSSNDLRSIAAAAVTLQPTSVPTLTVGFARTVIGTSSGWGEVPLRWLEVFHSVGHPNDVPLNDSALSPGGREQVTAFFARWRFPPHGLEVHAEWGRTEWPRSVRDFFVAPNHTQAYTLGLQWRNSPTHRFWRIQAEQTSLEQSPTLRDRPVGVWYTSRRVIQGYTNRGRMLGSGLGPGSSGQWLALDRFTPSRKLGVYAGRTRNNEDVRSIYAFPDYINYCVHDVTILGGVRASASTRGGLISLDVAMSNRINLWFQNSGGCPRSGDRVDVRNHTLSITLEPFTRPRR